MAFAPSWIDLIDEMGRLGVENVLLCRSGGNVESLAKEAGIVTVTAKSTMTNFPLLNAAYPSLLRRIRPDIVHTRLSHAARIAGFWGKFFRIPTVAMFDNATGKKKYYQNADHYLACSEWVKRYYVELGFDADAIRVIYNSVDVDKFRPDLGIRNEFREKLTIGPEEKVFVAVGRFVRIKGFDVLIQAFAELCRQYGNVRLLLVGDGPEHSKYVDLIAQHRLGEKVVFSKGFVEDVAPWLWASDYFVLPSKNEGFGIAILEAIAAALPVIVSNEGGPAEIVVDGVSGLQVSPQDISGLCAAMRRMLSMAGEQETEMKNKAKEGLIRFDKTTVTQQTIAFYKKVLQTPECAEN